MHSQSLSPTQKEKDMILVKICLSTTYKFIFGHIDCCHANKARACTYLSTFVLKHRTRQEKALTDSMHRQLLSPTEKEKGFYVSFSIRIYIYKNCLFKLKRQFKLIVIVTTKEIFKGLNRCITV